MFNPNNQKRLYNLIVEKHRMLLNYQLRSSIDSLDAREDLLQDVFLRLHRDTLAMIDDGKAPRYILDQRDGTFWIGEYKAYSYLIKAALWKGRDHDKGNVADAEKNREYTKHLDQEDHFHPDSFDMILASEAHNEQWQAIARAVNSLPTDQRNCIIMHFFLDMNCPQIAGLLNAEPTAIRKRLERAKSSLKTSGAIIGK